MKSAIRILAQCYDNVSGDILEEVVINDTKVLKAKTLRGLGGSISIIDLCCDFINNIFYFWPFAIPRFTIK